MVGLVRGKYRMNIGLELKFYLPLYSLLNSTRIGEHKRMDYRSKNDGATQIPVGDFIPNRVIGRCSNLPTKIFSARKMNCFKSRIECHFSARGVN